MPTAQNPLTQLEFSQRVAKRAQYEAFEFTVVPEGVRVRNGSHADPENHEYVVDVSAGVPTACTCPADSHADGGCKHRVAVAIREPVLEAATTQVAADGGTNVADGAARPDVEDEEECPDCLDELPCWECVRTGERELPD